MHISNGRMYFVWGFGCVCEWEGDYKTLRLHEQLTDITGYSTQGDGLLL